MENNTSLNDHTSMLRYFGDNVENCILFNFVFYTLVIGTLSVLGILGNILSIVVLQKDNNNKVAAFLLQSLAVADSLVLLTSFVVLSIIYGLLPYVQQSELFAVIIPYVVKYVHPLGYMGQCATIWITVLLAVNRFIAIVKPFLTAKLCTLNKARIQVLLVTILAVVFNMPRFFQYEIVQEHHPGSNHSVLVLNETVIGEYSLFGVIYTNIIYTIIVLIVPFLTLVILNSWLLRDLKCSTSKKNSSYSSTTSLNSTVSTKLRRRLSIGAPPLPEEDNITVIMITIVVIFLCCHTPDRIFQIIRYFFVTYEQILCGETLYYVSSVCNLLIVINSSTNFIIYYMMRRRFRKILMMKLCAWSNLTTYKEPPSYLDRHHGHPPPLLRRHTDDTIIINSVQQKDVKKVKLLLKTGSAPNLF